MDAHMDKDKETEVDKNMDIGMSTDMDTDMDRFEIKPVNIGYRRRFVRIGLDSDNIFFGLKTRNIGCTILLIKFCISVFTFEHYFF